MNQAVVEAFRGGGLTAADYAGMTPEQMQMVHGAGMQNAQMAVGIMQNQQEQQYRQAQAQFQREQFEFQKQVEQQRMELAKRADVRAEVDTMTNYMFKAAEHKLRQQELDLNKRLTNAQLDKLSIETDALKDQLETTKARREAIQAFGTEVVQVPGFPPMTMATASALLGEEKVVDTLVKLDIAKQANPSAEMQKFNLLRDYAIKRVGMSELNATRFAWVASQTDQGKMSSQEVLDILMKDRLFSIKEPNEQSAIVAEFMRIQNEHSLDLDKLLENYRPNATNSQADQPPIEPEPVPDPATETSSVQPSKVQTARDAVVQAFQPNPAYANEPLPPGFNLLDSSPPAEVPAEPQPQPEPVSGYNSKVLSRSSEVVVDRTRKSVGQPVDAVRKDGKWFLIYSSGFEQEVKSAIKGPRDVEKPTTQVVFLDGSRRTIRL